MKAIRVREFGEPHVLRLEEVDAPVAGPGELLVRIEAAGVNPVEAYVRAGWYAADRTLPYTPGSDAGGAVAAVGEGVRGFAADDRVFTSGSLTGTYAELALCRADHLHHLPERLTPAQGAAIGVPYVAAYRALFQRGDARAGETVLVHGATGGVGTAAVQLAHAAGLTVYGTAGSDSGRRHALEQGAAHALDHSTPDHVDELFELTAGRGVDLIVELLANVNLDRDLSLIAPRGRVVVVGSRGTVEINPRDLMNREGDIRAMRLPNAAAAELAEAHEAIGRGLVDGSLRPVVAAEFPLGEAARAHRDLMERAHGGKIVLIP